MKVAECVSRVEVLQSGHQGRYWETLVLDREVTDRLMHQALLASPSGSGCHLK